ncbi:MAG: hypothetical protein HY820_28775 [Acidobacteria bacterium]|nr:hypothetical protein [Acidobacteriota bacterium]
MMLIRVLATLACAVTTTLAQNGKIPTCDGPEFHQFDFWIGDWQVRSGGQTVGYSRIESLLNGCLIVENWYGLDGDIGKSMNFYDRRSSTWRQVYVGAGWNIDYQGAPVEGGMQFLAKQGSVRLTFTRDREGLVRQHKQQSPDGTDWRTVYDFTYERRHDIDPAFMTAARDASTRCSKPAAREFDFWAGDWDVFVPRGRAGANTIQPVAGGCVLLENWSGLGGVDGKSFNFVDNETGEWRQVWVSAGGNLDLRGKWDGRHLRLSGENKGPQGATLQQRITWTPRIDGAVRQHWEQSRDGGATWVTAFDGTYLRRASV